MNTFKGYHSALAFRWKQQCMLQEQTSTTKLMDNQMYAGAYKNLCQYVTSRGM